MYRGSGLHVPQIIVTPDREIKTNEISVDSVSSSETADEADEKNHGKIRRNLRCRISSTS